MGRKTGMTELDARKKYGDEIIERLLAQHCDFTNRLDYVLKLNNEHEFSACVDIDDSDEYEKLTIYYYEDMDDVQNCDGDLGCLSWNDFVIVEE